jgi:thiol-disulfide isomerase/thioredoxin
MMNKYLIFCAMGLLFSACQSQRDNVLKEGRWHARFQFEGGDVPFLFEVKESRVTLINGEERVLLDSVSYEGDSVVIPIKAYDTELRGRFTGDSLSGVFRRLFADQDEGIPFTALLSDAPRFSATGVSADSLAGRWDIHFAASDGETSDYVGIFNQQGNSLTGSILTNSGDFRFMEGVADEHGFRLSSFAGLSLYLIEGKFIDKDHFEGRYVNARGVQTISGTRNDKAAMSDPYSLTQLKKGFTGLGFKLKDLAGVERSLSDAKYRGKAVVVSILGSWCPNCLDETALLSPWYKANKDRGVEIIALAFERKDDPAYIRNVLSNLISKYDITYDLLIGGKIADASQVLPEIDAIKSFPTTLFINKRGEVTKIHTGFNGPATGLFYEEFKADFNRTINELLK